jgi:hypothetical protein
LRANGSRECASDDRLREAIHLAARKVWIASPLALLAMAEADRNGLNIFAAAAKLHVHGKTSA